MTEQKMKEGLEALLYAAEMTQKSRALGLPINWDILLDLQIATCKEALGN